MIAVVEPDGEDARRVEQRGVKAHFCQAMGGEGVAMVGLLNSGGNDGKGIGVARGAQIHHQGTVFNQESGADVAIGKGKGYEFHADSVLCIDAKK